MQIKRTAKLNSKGTFLLIVMAAFLLASCSASKDYIIVKTYDGKKTKYYTENPDHPWQYAQPNPFISCKVLSATNRAEKKNIPSLVATSN
jgi:hypothetical protein